MHTASDTPKSSRKQVRLLLAASCAIIVAVSIALVFLLRDGGSSSHPALADLNSQAPVKQALALPVPGTPNPSELTPNRARPLPAPTLSQRPSPQPQPSRLPPGDPDLFDAVWRGKVAEVQRLLRAGAEANVSDPDGDPYLREAIFRGHPEIASLLIDAGADVNARTADGDSLIHQARFWHEPEIEQLLLEAGAKE